MASKLGSNQHYVPQFLMRPWTVTTKKGEGRVWVYDKLRREIKDRVPKRICSDIGYYDCPDGKTSFDGFITAREDEAAFVIQRMREQQSLSGLGRREQESLALFVALQYCRSPRVRSSLEGLSQGTLLSDGKLMVECFRAEYPGLSAKEVQLQWFADFVFRLARYWFTKRWMVVNVESANLAIGDHPLVMCTQIGRDSRNVLPEATLYLPIAPHLMLCMAKRELTRMHPGRLNYDGICGQMWLGRASMDRAQSELLNRFQAMSAVRYIVSNTCDFGWYDDGLGAIISALNGDGPGDVNSIPRGVKRGREGRE